LNTAARTTLVHDRLVHCLADEIGAIAQPLTLFEWMTTDLADPSNLHRPYGWVPPYEIDGEPAAEAATVVAPFCPALIADQTRFLLQREFEQYLDTIEYQLCLHIVHRSLPWQEPEALVDRLLYDTAPGSMELQNRVLLRILDRLSEPSSPPDHEQAGPRWRGPACTCVPVALKLEPR
jgi:hypothetical protein